MKRSEQVSMMRSSDLSKGMTLRNAGENRRLVGHIQQLDLQLRSNLVNLQAEISELKLSSGRQRPRSSYGSQQIRTATIGISPPAVERINSETSSKPFLPAISAKQTALVGKEIEGVERPHLPRSPGTSRRRRIAPKSGNDQLSLSSTADLYRPKSSPNLNIGSSMAESVSSSPSFRQLSPLKQSSLEKDGFLVSRSSEDVSVSASPAQLNKRVRDFLQRPNTSSDERENVIGTNAANETPSKTIPKINIEQGEGDEINGTINSDVDENDLEGRGFLTDVDLFRNSLLLRASRDDGLSRSLPDLSSLGFMDFNEVIDQRLRKVRDDLPSEKEMRKIRYLRFRDEPAPLSLKEIFEKESQSSRDHLDKIDE
ncbi:uncharacterized protein [Montipora foliosa]|uniref:uncharacterized protein n=1 Tax=Montipora foliosa TaxID=591990 RepID=UPI0035F11589